MFNRINPGAAASVDSLSSTVSEAATSDTGGSRPRLSTSILSNRSQNRSFSSINVEPPTSEGTTPVADPTFVAPPAGEEPPKDLAKDKIHRGYKNVPSLDAITERMRSRTGSTAADPGVAAAAVAMAKLSTKTPATDTEATASKVPTSFNSEADAGVVALSSKKHEAVPAPAKPASYFPAGSSDKLPSSDPDDSHPLQYTWTLYHDARGRNYGITPATPIGEDNHHYAAGLTVIGDFETVENFCRYFNWLKPPSQLETGSNYHLFKKGIKPMWEDPANANVGPDLGI